MTFQFLCPQQHLLQGDESQMGQQCQCPQCGIVFIIPTVQLQQPQQYGAPAHDPYGQQPYGQQYAQPYAPQQYAPQYGQPNPFTEPQPDPYTSHLENYAAGQEQYVAPHDEPYVAPHEAYAQQPGAPAGGEFLGHLETSGEAGVDEATVDVEAEPGPRVVHIPCPNGHELETPLDMIGQEVLCPHCSAQFRLRNEDSVEFKEYQEKLDIKRSHLWFNLSIAAAVVVGLGLLIMILVSMQHK